MTPEEIADETFEWCEHAILLAFLAKGGGTAEDAVREVTKIHDRVRGNRSERAVMTREDWKAIFKAVVRRVIEIAGDAP